MLDTVYSPQRRNRVIPLRITGHATTPVVAEGGQHIASITRDGAGDYDIVFKQAFGRIPVIVASNEGTVGGISSVTDVSATGFTLKMTTHAGVASDFNSHLIVWGFDAAEQS